MQKACTKCGELKMVTDFDYLARENAMETNVATEVEAYLAVLNAILKEEE